MNVTHRNRSSNTIIVTKYCAWIILMSCVELQLSVTLMVLCLNLIRFAMEMIQLGGRFINCMFVVCLTQWDLNKTDSILQTFSYTLSFNTVLDFDLNVSEVYFLWYNWQQASIGLGDGFAPTRRQTITWANDDPIHWHMYASLGTDDLNKLILANSKIV